MWIWNEKRIEDQHNLENHIQEELFRLKLYRNMIEIKEYQQTQPINKIIKSNHIEYYSPDDIKQILEKTAKFTQTNLS